MLKKVLSYLPMMSLAFCLLPAAAFAQTGASSLTNPRAKNVNVSSSVVALPGSVAPGHVNKAATKANADATGKFKVRPDVNLGWNLLYTFTGQAPDLARNPAYTLVEDGAGNLYTTFGVLGGNGKGQVFELSADGTPSQLYSFQTSNDGYQPYGSLVLDASGNLWGTTRFGGAGCTTSTPPLCSQQYGTFFNVNDATGVETTVTSFTAAGLPYRLTGNLVEDSNGNFYGDTVSGGTNGQGNVYELTSAGVYTDLYDFTTTGSSDGNQPQPQVLAMDGSGNLYGTTSQGGPGSCGGVFEVNPATKIETVLYSFTGGADGCNPAFNVVRDAAGNIYGTANAGTSTYGTVWMLSPSGTLTVLYNFTDGTDGGTPRGQIAIDGAGNLYGTTSIGGAHAKGVLYKVSSGGVFSVLHAFNSSSDGNTPTGVYLGPDGNLYGTITNGGGGNMGTIWGYGLPQIIPNETLGVILAGTGTGTVAGGSSSNQTAINCGSTCSASFPQNTAVTLTATTAGNSTFTSWSGCTSTSGITCNVTMSGTENVTATFTLAQSATTTTVSCSPSTAQYGLSVSCAATVTGSGTPTGSVMFYDNGSSLGSEALSGGTAQYTTTSLPVGSDPITASYGGDSNNLSSTSTSFSETVTTIPTAISWSAPAAITYGTPLSAMQLNATVSPSVAGTFAYTPAAGTVLNAGANQALSVTFTPTNTNYATSTGTVQITVNAAPTAITWTAPAAIAYGTALSAAQLNATVSPSVVGTFAYTPAAGTVLNAGTNQTLSVTFTPSSPNYLSSTGGTTISVIPSATTISWPAPSPITYGTALSSAQLDATAYLSTGGGSVVTRPKVKPQLGGCTDCTGQPLPGTFVYTPGAGTVLGAGSQTLSVTFTPASSNYASSTGSVTLTVNQAAATVTFSNMTQTYTGSALSPTVTTTPAGLNVTLTGAPDTSAGNYAVTATVNDPNYTGSASGTFVINKAAATVAFSNLTQTYTGSALSPTVTTTPAGLTTTLTGAPDTNAGSYPVTATITNPNYTGSASGTFVISKATATVTFSNLTQTYTGSALSPTVTTIPAGLTTTLTGAPDTNAGSYTVTATINDPNYTGSASGTFVISKATATVTFSNLTQIYTGSALSPTVTTSPTSLSYSLTGAPDTNVGSYPVTATITNPNYTGSASGTFVINATGTKKPRVSLTVPSARAVYNSTFTVTAADTSEPGNVASITASGACTNSGAAVTMTAGTGVCTITAAWAGDVTYEQITATKTVTAELATPSITWAPDPIVYGTQLGPIQQDATANVLGTFSYRQVAGTVLGVGTHTLSATFTPNANDPTAMNYKAVSATTQLTVTQATTTTTIASAIRGTTPATANHLTVNFQVVGQDGGKVTGSVVVTDNNSIQTCTGTVSPTTGMGHCTIVYGTTGSTSLTATYGATTDNGGSFGTDSNVTY